MSVTAFIQARLGSTRLPGKVLLDLCGKPVLERVIERVSRARNVDRVVVLTTLSPLDLPIVRLCAERGILVYCGSVEDVLDRFYQAAKVLCPDNIVRVTADCPVMDPSVIEEVVARHLESGADYTANVFIERYPDGEDVEVMTFPTLRRAWQEASLGSEREHVTLYVRNHPEMFRHASVICPEDHSGQRWTLDTDRDYAFLKALYQELGPGDEYFGMDDVLALLQRKPEILALNNGIQRNEGLAKSLHNDLAMQEAD